MTDFPDVRLKMLPQFPVRVSGGPGIDVVISSGTYTFNLAVNELAQVGSVATTPAATTFVLLWDSASGSYSRISLTALKTTLAALP